MDAAITRTDTEVGTDAVAELAASGTGKESVELVAPSAAGTYYYGACVDAVTAETDTTNNCSTSVRVAVRTTVTEPQEDEDPRDHPDLRVMSPAVSDSGPAAGAPFTLSATVRNAGAGAAAATMLRYYRSADATITTTDTQVGTAAIAGLAATGSAGDSVDLTAPSRPGTYSYGACVDAVADESDTTNNCSLSVQVTVHVTVTPPRGDPDLIVTAVEVSDSGLEAEATFTLSAAVRNEGEGTSEPTALRYYQSTDTTITATDTWVGTVTIAGLAGSGSSSGSVELTAPSNPGKYYYGACVDAVPGESDTTNNCSRARTVRVVEGPDLVVGGPFVFDRTPEAGGTVLLLGVGAKPGRCDVGDDDGAALPLDRRDAHERRHVGGHGGGAAAWLFAELRGTDLPDGALDARHVLLRLVRGRGAGGIRHDEQLLGLGAGDGIGAGSECAERGDQRRGRQGMGAGGRYGRSVGARPG